MGCFSWNCRGCGFSANMDGPWMSKVVVLDANESRIVGDYDGYGRVGSTELNDLDGKFELWHQSCWRVAGKPEYSKPSLSARDQGLQNHDNDFPEPTKLEHLLALNELRGDLERREREKIRQVWFNEREKMIANKEIVPEWVDRLVIHGGDITIDIETSSKPPHD